MKKVEVKKLDKRVVKTKKALRSALFELMKEKSVSRITVVDLCQVAHVNRGTFYKYYDDAYDLWRSIEERALGKFKELLDTVPLMHNPDMFVRMSMALIHDDRELSQAMFASGDLTLARRIVRLVHDDSIEHWRKKLGVEDEETLEHIYIFTMNGLIGIVRNWAEGGWKEDVETMGNFVCGMIDYGATGFASKKD